jgi:hypothetical protein
MPFPDDVFQERQAFQNSSREKEIRNTYRPDSSFAQFTTGDFPSAAFEADQQFKNLTPGVKRTFNPWQGQLPYSTTPRTYENPMLQMIPEPTRVSRVCFNDALEKSGPWYLRSWQPWENAPFLPSVGDVTKDPRFGEQTKGFTTEYKKLL